MKSIVYSILLLSITICCSAQKTEIGITGGFSNYFGDINTSTSFRHIHPSSGIFLRNNLGLRTAIRTSFNYASVEAWDRDSKDEYYRQRNLSFKSDIMEMNFLFEFNFFKYWHGAHNNKYKFSPYLATGFSLFYFNPKAEYNGEWVELQPLGTEGQNNTEFTGRKKYSLLSTSIPIIGGLKYNLDQHWSIGLEAGVRKTFTDYLDDVSTTYVSSIYLPDGYNGLSKILSDRSIELGAAVGIPGQQRGDSNKKDDYFILGINISYTIIRPVCNVPGEKVF